ncbi:hypothetical protein DENIS_0514 [Desulfonema ishimotonii]|uniref:Histidine kinase n=1 Tax=Desulfonema ishimotonii TaxID=45657 RepID=A0A401FRJ1_9BACT|nr:PAS domain S-box protein [Desulfonema ishimotonii]GBC59575.1 hypothetical protein DENIS_0514 [Desulfonema ishimotonii]
MTLRVNRHYVMIVEDDTENAELLNKMLSGAGYDVAWVDSGPAALAAARRKPPDLILLDVLMPEMDGYEVCRHLKADPATRKIPVIFISGMNDERTGLQAGAVDYIRKPMSPAIIRARVRTHLELKRYRDYLEGLVRERTRELETANRRLQEEVAVRKKAESNLRKYQGRLEGLVRQRTAALSAANERLQKEIFEKKQAEKQLKEREETYRSVFENTGSATLIVEEDMTISMANAECEKLTGFSREEIQGKRKWIDFVAPQDAERLTMYHRLRRQGVPVPTAYECSLIDAKGRKKDIFVQVDLIPGTRKSVASWIDMTARKRSETALKENEAYLRTIMSTIQTGVLITDPETCRIADANPCAAKMIGIGADQLIGRDYRRYVRCEPGEEYIEGNPGNMSCPRGEKCDRVIQTACGEQIHVRHAYAHVGFRDREYVIQSFLDITDIKKLLKKQDINIDLSRNILNLVNRVSPRHTLLSGKLLFFDALAVPCHKQGGDHYFVRNLPAWQTGKYVRKTLLSLKDQSGHEVGCVLRSIITDLIHHAVLTRFSHRSFEEGLTRLNREICKLGLFRGEDFFTSVNVEIDHRTLVLKYTSAGHPPFLLIRENEIHLLPETGENGANMPMGIVTAVEYGAGTFQLRVGDRLLFYTDGLPEMTTDNTGQMLSLPELREITARIVRQRPQIPVSELMRDLLDTIADMSGKEVCPPGINTSGDDITLIGLELEDDTAWQTIRRSPQATEAAVRMASELHREIAGEWRIRGYEDPDIRLWTVLEEGIFNAWKHGNRRRPEASVTVRWRYGNDFYLEIEDEGDGFDPETVSDPTSDENIMQTSGRGIFMIRYYGDSVRWTNRGRCIRVTFRKTPKQTQGPSDPVSSRLVNLWTSH